MLLSWELVLVSSYGHGSLREREVAFLVSRSCKWPGGISKRKGVFRVISKAAFPSTEFLRAFVSNLLNVEVFSGPPPHLGSRCLPCPCDCSFPRRLRPLWLSTGTLLISDRDLYIIGERRHLLPDKVIHKRKLRNNVYFFKINKLSSWNCEMQATHLTPSNVLKNIFLYFLYHNIKLWKHKEY